MGRIAVGMKSNTEMSEEFSGPKVVNNWSETTGLNNLFLFYNIYVLFIVTVLLFPTAASSAATWSRGTCYFFHRF